jgi:hypothetical protein
MPTFPRPQYLQRIDKGCLRRAANQRRRIIATPEEQDVFNALNLAYVGPRAAQAPGSAATRKRRKPRRSAAP